MILVTGATGLVGSAVVKQLSAKQVPVRLFVRNLEKGKSLGRAGVELVEGDFEKPQTLEAAMRGVERVFLLTPQHPQQTRHQGDIIEAAQRAGVKHIVKLSTIASNPESVSFVARSHWQTEQQLEQSGLNYTLLQPHQFMQQSLERMGPSVAESGVFTTPAATAKISMIDVRDIAAVAVAALTEEGHNGKRYHITGPAALSAADMAERFTTILGKPITYKAITLEEYQNNLQRQGLPQHLVTHLVEINRFFLAGGNEAVTNVVYDITGQPPRPFEKCVSETLQLFVRS
jgi:uncharacterized protein YbjT (DUF2867 family)